jgi:hypothetical protein
MNDRRRRVHHRIRNIGGRLRDGGDWGRELRGQSLTGGGLLGFVAGPYRRREPELGHRLTCQRRGHQAHDGCRDDQPLHEA